MEALPSYDESLGRPLVLQQTNSQSDDGSSVSSNAPPAFSISPITLTLSPKTTIIKPIYHEVVETRALYELTAPVDGSSRAIFLAEVSPITRLDKHGHLPQIEKRHHLYKIFGSQEGSQKHMAIDGRKTRTMHGTMLRRSADGTSLVATNHGDLWGSQGQLIYYARLNAEVMEWMDSKGRVVAIDHMAANETTPETLQVLVPLNRKWLDMLVAVWISRIHEGAQQAVEREVEDCTRHRGETRARRQSSLLNGSKSFFRRLSK